MSTHEVLLVTASINIGNTVEVTVKNPDERLFEYLVSLIAWIELTKIKVIVFCENTNTNYNFDKIKAFAQKKNKILETIVFDGNKGAQKYGKGYGEGKIIKYAIENSKYLNEKTIFYKITGRLFLNEFEKVREIYRDYENVFQIPAFPPETDPFLKIRQKNPETIFEYGRNIFRFLYVFFGRGKGRGPHVYINHASTVFYKVSVNFYRKNLLNSFTRVNERKSYILEHVFYEDIINKNIKLFNVSLKIVGRGGASGRLYPDGYYSDKILEMAKLFL